MSISESSSKNVRYRNNPKHWDRQAYANSTDPDQMPQNVASDQALHCLPSSSFELQVNSFKMDHDWQSGKTVAECNAEMLTHEILCDVTFLVGQTHPFTVLKAHKYVLVSRSATFYDYFCGDKPPDPMMIVRSIDPDVFRHLLWYIYTDEIRGDFTLITPLLHAARLYQLESLVKACLKRLAEKMDATNACSVLKQACDLGETQLAEECLEYIYGHANQVFMSDSFLELTTDQLGKIINSDALRADEDRVYEAVYAWSGSECRRQKLRATDRNRQRVVGNLKYLIRFPVMDVEYFKNHVSNQNLLTQDEKEALFRYLHSRSAPDMEWFITRKRALTRAIRFDTTAGMWPVGKFNEAIQFQSSHEISLDGVLVYGCYYVSCDYEVTVKVFNIRGEVLCETRAAIHTTIDQDIYDIFFDKALPIKAQTWYTIGLFMLGPPTKRGVQGRERIYIEKVHFFFKTCNMTQSMSSLKEGQIPGLIFH